MIGIVFAGDQADRRGGWPFVIGLVLFASGLIVGGLAPSMPVLVAGRFVQGFGAGVVPAIGYVVIGRAFTDAERPRLFALLSTAWVVPGLIGPVVAEQIAQAVGWRWVFLGLVPLVAVAGALVVPAMARLGPLGGDARPAMPFLRRRMLEASRVAVGGRDRGELQCIAVAARARDRRRPPDRPRAAQPPDPGWHVAGPSRAPPWSCPGDC